MKIFSAVVLFCIMALGAFAYQGSTQQPAQVPQGAGIGNPAAQPGTAPQPAVPQSQSGTVQNPQTQAPQTESSPAPPMRSGTPGVDDQVSALTAALNLNSDQQAKVKTILEGQHQQAVNVVNDSSLPMDAKMQKIHALRQSTIDQVRGTLTTDQQKSKFDTMIQAQNERIREREQQQQQQEQQQQPNNTPAPK